MSSEPAPANPSPPPEAPAPAPTPAKRPGIIRTSAVLLLLFLVLAVVASVPFVIEPWIVGQLRGAITNAGLELSPSTVINVSLVNGRVEMTQVKISETYKGETRVVLAADDIAIDLAMLDCLAGDVVIDRLVATGLTGDLTRRGDGTIPLITPEADSAGTDWSKVDWWGYGKKAIEYAKEKKIELEKEQEEAEKLPPEQRPKPAPEPATNWPQAKQYQPTPIPGGRGTRVLIRHLEVSGKAFGLPDSTPFDITSFSLVGSDVTGIQLPDEKMTLTGDLVTKGAGIVKITMTRDHGEAGDLTLACPALPLQVLSDPAVSGQALAPYGASGNANLTVTTQWDGWKMVGRIDSVLTNFDLNPTDGSSESKQAAQIVKRLKGKPITWPIQFGGMLYAPTITDSGVDEMLKGGLGDAAKEAAKEEALKQGEKLLEKEGAKNPEVKKATDLLKGLGGSR